MEENAAHERTEDLKERMEEHIQSMQKLMRYGFFTLGGILLTYAGFQIA